MTGKGDRWGRDSVGRSEPAFLSANTTALPHLPARRETGQSLWQLLFLLQGRPTVGRSLVLRPVPSGESAGCVRLQCLFSRLFVACHPLPARPTALKFLPRSSCFAPIHLLCLLVHVHVRQDRRLGPAVCQLQDCPVGSCNTGLQWRPVHRSIKVARIEKIQDGCHKIVKNY